MIVHLLLFALATLVVVVMAAFYAEADDRAALASVPKRFVRFYLSCVVLGGVVWLLGLPW